MKSLKVFFLFVVLLSVFGGVVAQTPEWAWANKAGDNFADGALSSATDSNGNTYVTGHFAGTNVAFDAITLTSYGHTGQYGQADIFVAKLGSGVDVSDDLNPPVISITMSASPNPFKQGTTLKIAMDKTDNQYLRVVLYDIKGRRV